MVNIENNDIVILSLKDGHDGAVALIVGNHLEFSVEAEKDNGLRFSSVTPDALLKVSYMIKKPVGIVAQSGWSRAHAAAWRATASRVRCSVVLP